MSKLKKYKKKNFWTKDMCHNYALKYKHKIYWQKKHPVSYQKSLKMGWIKELSSHMILLRGRKWTINELKREALKYKTRTDFQKKNPSAYKHTYNKKLLDKICRHMTPLKKPKGYWTIETISKDAKKYKTKTEWESHSGTAFNLAWKLGVMEEITVHMNKLLKINGKHLKWTKEKCLEAARKCKTRREWLEKYPGSVNASYHNGWAKECKAHMVPPSNGNPRAIYYFIDPIKKIAYVGLSDKPLSRKNQHLRGKTSKKELVEAFNAKRLLYKVSKKFYPQELAQEKERQKISYFKRLGYKMLNKSRGGALGSNIRKWNEQSIIKESKKYKSISCWKKHSASSYQKSHTLKIFDKCTAHMNLKRNSPGTWTKEKCISIAKQYKTKNDWFKANFKSFIASKNHGWFHECTKHMIDGRTIKITIAKQLI